VPTSLLRVEFETEEDFRREYAGNIVNGGIFVSSRDHFEVLDLVRVELVLAYCDKSFEFDAEVVHWIPPEMAGAGVTPGVALQLQKDVRELRAEFESVAGPVDQQPASSGGRAALRIDVRLPVQVTLPDGSRAAGRTRNLGSSGMLLALPGHSLAVGAAVKATIKHPAGDEDLTLDCTVVRQVECDETGVAAFGLEFDPSESQRADAREFASRVRLTERSRQLASITGPIDGLGVESLLKMFALTTSQGTLTLTHGATEGFVVFENGIFLGAELAGSTGFEALATLLTWSSGRFELEKSVTLELPEQGPVPLDAALWEAAQGTAAPARTTHETEAPASAVAASEVALAGDRVESCDVASDDDDVALDDDEIAFDDDDIASDDSDIAFDEGDVASDDGEIAFDDGDIVSDDGEIAFDDGDIVSDDYDEIEFDLDLELDFERESQPEPVAAEELQPPRPAIAEVDFSRLSPTATLSVDQAAVDDAQGELGKIEEALVDLASVGMTVAKAVDVIPEPDDDVYRALAGLADQGLVKLAD